MDRPCIQGFGQSPDTVRVPRLPVGTEPRPSSFHSLPFVITVPVPRSGPGTSLVTPSLPEPPCATVLPARPHTAPAPSGAPHP